MKKEEKQYWANKFPNQWIVFENSIPVAYGKDAIKVCEEARLKGVEPIDMVYTG